MEIDIKSEPEVLWGGPAIYAFIKELTGEADLTLAKFYQRAAAGKYGPLRKRGSTITATPRELREQLTGCSTRQSAAPALRSKTEQPAAQS